VHWKFCIDEDSALACCKQVLGCRDRALQRPNAVSSPPTCIFLAVSVQPTGLSRRLTVLCTAVGWLYVCVEGVTVRVRLGGHTDSDIMSPLDFLCLVPPVQIEEGC
jgi:hypothetical protein